MAYFLLSLAVTFELVNLWIYLRTVSSGFPLLSILLAGTAAYVANDWPLIARLGVVAVTIYVHFAMPSFLFARGWRYAMEYHYRKRGLKPGNPADYLPDSQRRRERNVRRK